MNKKILIASAFLAAATMVSALTTWSGANGDYRVDTGLDDGSDESGYWYTYSDDANSGTSAITWPVATGNEYDDNALDPIIDNCGGLCGTVTLGAGYDYPFAGLGFNLTGPDQTGADVTAWGGLCITYTAGVAPILEIAPEDEATVTEYNNYMSKLKVAASASTLNLAWSDFKQESGWGVTVPQASYLTMIAAVKVKFSGKAGTSGDFNIMKLVKMVLAQVLLAVVTLFLLQLLLLLLRQCFLAVHFPSPVSTPLLLLKSSTSKVKLF